MNKKQTSKNISSKASKILSSINSSVIQKKLAVTVLFKSNTRKQTSKCIENKASKVLKSSKYNCDTTALAGSVLAQSNKK